VQHADVPLPESAELGLLSIAQSHNLLHVFCPAKDRKLSWPDRLFVSSDQGVTSHSEKDVTIFSDSYIFLQAIASGKVVVDQIYC